MALLVLALAIGLSAALLAPGLLAGPSMDAAVFALVADSMLDGATPYVDLWDHKPPGIYLLNGASQAALPWLTAWHASWMLTVLAVAASGLLVWHLLAGVGQRWLGVFGAVLAVAGLSQYVVALGGGLTEQLAALPATGAFLLAQRYGLVRWGVAGVLVAIAVFISPHLAAAGVALLVLAVMRPAVTGRLLAALLLGAALPVVGVFAWLWGAGALPAALDQVLVYNAAYRAVNAGAAESTSASVLALTVLSSLFLLVPGAAGVAALRRLSQSRRRIALPALAWMLAGAVLVALTGRVYAHYLAHLAVPLALLAAIGGEDVLHRIKQRGLVTFAAALMGFSIMGSATAVVSYLPQGARAIEALGDRSAELAGVVAQLTEEDGPIFVWGNAPSAYIATDRPSAGRYLYLFPLMTPGYSSPAQLEALLAEWSSRPPELIVDAGSAGPGQPGWAPLLIHRPVLDVDPRRLDLLDPLREFVSSNYREVANVDGWPVYAPREGS